MDTTGEVREVRGFHLGGLLTRGNSVTMKSRKVVGTVCSEMCTELLPVSSFLISSSFKYTFSTLYFIVHNF